MKYIFKNSCIGVSIFKQAGASPTITLVSVGDITDSTANVNVSIADGDDVSKTGVEIDIDATFSNPTSYEENGAVNTIAVDNLTAETTYYVRAYVIWNGQTIYSSNSLNFTTESGGILPSALQACEYLESGDDCYINLPFNPANFTYIKGKVEYNTSSNNILVCGSNLNTNHLQLYYTSGHWVIRYFCSNTNTKNTNISNLVANFEFNDSVLKLNSYSINVNYALNKNVSNTFFLFGQITNNNNIDWASFIKWYNLETNLFNLISCYIKSGKTFTDKKGNVCGAGTCGMYDIVNQVFYTNDGTGTFSKGGDINI